MYKINIQIQNRYNNSSQIFNFIQADNVNYNSKINI